MPRMTRLALILLVTGSSQHALAGETVIYRCTGADGSLALQSMPCPKGSQQQVRHLSADYAPPVSSLPVTSPLPAPSPDPSLVTHRPAGGTPAVTETLLPLPALHHCQPRRGPAYYTDDLAESVRCLPLQVTGLDGNPATGAGEACEIQRDTCEVVATGNTCAAWQDYLQQSLQRFADASLRDSQTQDVRSTQIAAMLAASACARPISTTQNP